MSVRRGRPTVAEINVAALRRNLRQVRALVGPAVDILAVVKANGYGHGAVAAARAFVAEARRRSGSPPSRRVRSCGARDSRVRSWCSAGHCRVRRTMSSSTE